MIENSAWQTVLSSANDISTVAEFYSSDAVPGDDGFDPADAVGLFAAVLGDDGDELTYMGQEYTQLVSGFGSVKRSTGKQANIASVTFSNVSREVSRFEFTIGFEGLIMVIRTISRSQSDTLGKSQILFAGRCDKPTAGSKESLQVSATWILGGPDIQIPYRKYTPDDQEGRTESDPEFEGFKFMPLKGSNTYSTREKKGGLLGLFGFKKTVQHTLTWSSFSDTDSNKAVPEVLGKSQLQLTHIGYADVGTFLKIRSAACQGPIYDMRNIRSLDSRLPLGPIAPLMGLVGAANGPDDPTWIAPGYYSRTAHIRTAAVNSLVSETDAAPDIVAEILGRMMMATGRLGVSGAIARPVTSDGW
jgi:hypothetical protein